MKSILKGFRLISGFYLLILHDKSHQSILRREVLIIDVVYGRFESKDVQRFA